MPGVPVGTIVSYGGRNIPNGWLLCDGNMISRIQYNNLFLAIDSVWGNGDGFSTFHLPDLRGQFLRGVSASSNIDPDTSNRISKYNGGNIGNKVGSFQNDELKSHNHTSSSSPYANGSSGVQGPLASGNGTAPPTGYTGGNETRPKNAYVYYIVKY
jgi:microcystin-dependent protein